MEHNERQPLAGGSGATGSVMTASKACEQTGMLTCDATAGFHDPSPGDLDAISEQRFDVLLLCDVTGVIVDAKQPPYPNDDTVHRSLVGNHLSAVLGPVYLGALNKMLERRPWASLPFRYSPPGRQAKRCRVLIRKLSGQLGVPNGLLVVLHGLELSEGEPFTAVTR